MAAKNKTMAGKAQGGKGTPAGGAKAENSRAPMQAIVPVETVAPVATATEIATFARELAELLEAGRALVPALAEMGDRTQNLQLRDVIRRVALGVRAGHAMAAVMELFPGVFDAAYVCAVRRGESNGTLEEVLREMPVGDDTPLDDDASADDEMLTFDETLQFLGTSRQTLFRSLREGRLRGLRVGRQWRFRRTDLAAYLEGKPEVIAAAATGELDKEFRFFSNLLHESGGESKNGDMAELSDDDKIIAIDNAIIALAIKAGASDIHLEGMHLEDEVCALLRFREDGVLREIRRMPSRLLNPLIARFKVMGDMNAAQRDVPQDGRIPVQYKESKFDLRVNSCPSTSGESLVMRIINQASKIVSLEQLGMEPEDMAKMREWLHRPNGLILVTGPSGSGKLTALYSCISEINNPTIKVMTLEDPVEFSLPGVIQSHFVRKTGLSFGAVLRFFLRQDPDVIMVGEIPDLETAELTAQAALTGHLMLSSLHANSTSEAVMRLKDMGLEPFVLSAALTGISSQRLARRICSACKEEAGDCSSIVSHVRKQVEDGGYLIPRNAKFQRGRGCERCHGNGYRGRMALYELMTWSAALADGLMRGADREELTRIAVAGGMKTLLADGALKAVQGETTLEEVVRVLGVAL